MDVQELGIWIFFLILTLLGIVALILFIRLQKKLDRDAAEAVKRYSTYYQRALEVNSRYSFHWDILGNGNVFFFEEKETKSKYDKRQLIDILYDGIKDDQLAIGQALSQVEANRKTYQVYESEMFALHSEMTEERCKELKVSYSRFLKKEQELVSSLLLRPVLTLQVRCRKEYTSPAGRNEYYAERIFPEVVVRRMSENVKRDINVRHTEEYRRKKERARVTDKVRYQVMQRDGFRCQLCGASQADGVKLHVDHKIPISKGGNSDPDNLRTLCDRCNWGKGSQLEDEVPPAQTVTT